MNDRGSLQAFFEPTSVAIVGASSDGDKLSGKPLRFLKEAGFQGRLLPVNPRATLIQGLPAYARVEDIDGPVDHAVIVLPAEQVQQALEACGRKGIRAVQVFTSGFAEAGEAGAQRQAALLQTARAFGMRLLGPNCLGIVSVRHRFFATFSTALDAMTPSAGVIGLATQSGAFGSCAYATAVQRGLGLSRIVATGNEADIDVADCIAYMADDPQTRVICAAIEGCSDGPRLRKALRHAALARKPVIVMKVGRSVAGAKAAATHTGALAGDDAIFDTVFAECGAWRAGSIEEMLDIAALCACGVLPKNRHAGIVTLSGGIGVLMADACEPLALALPPLPDTVSAEIRDIVPFAATGNPMDTTAQVAAVSDGLCRVLERMLAGTDWGTVFLYMAQKAAAPERFGPTLRLLAQIRARHAGRCIVLVGPSDPSVAEALRREGLIIFTDPSRAVAAAGAAATLQARWDEMAEDEPRLEHPPTPAPTERPGDESGAKRALADFGLRFQEELFCISAEVSAQAASALGFPVAMKVLSADIAHKTEVGGVALGLRDANEVRQRFESMLVIVRKRAPTARIDGVLVSKMLSVGGIELILGLQRDPIFGPIAIVGLGGVTAELTRDVTFASVPFSMRRAERMVRGLKCAALFDGWRGAPAIDVAPVVDALLKLSTFAEACGPALESVEINPFVVDVEGGVGLDALIRWA